jgi:hypothetical protein
MAAIEAGYFKPIEMAFARGQVQHIEADLEQRIPAQVPGQL